MRNYWSWEKLLNYEAITNKLVDVWQATRFSVKQRENLMKIKNISIIVHSSFLCPASIGWDEITCYAHDMRYCRTMADARLSCMLRTFVHILCSRTLILYRMKWRSSAPGLWEKPVTWHRNVTSTVRKYLKEVSWDTALSSLIGTIYHHNCTYVLWSSSQAEFSESIYKFHFSAG